jgi:chromosome segregation ATPase
MEDKNKDFERVCSLKYQDQAKFFLNAFWSDLSSKGEDIYLVWQKFVDLDKQQWSALPEGKRSETWSEGCSLDEFWSHKLLEINGNTMSVVEFRTEFKKIDTNVDKRMGIVEYLLWTYKQTVKTLLERPQGSGDASEIIKAQKMLDEVSAAFADAEKRKKELAVAEAELKKELATLKEQEESYNNKTKELTTKAEGSGVSAMRAKNELAQHLAEDPLPLRKAKLSTEAATKKAERARTKQEEAVQECAKRLEDAEAYLHTVISKGSGPALGTLWWIERELKEKKKYLPKK